MKTSWLAAAGVVLALTLWMASGLLRDGDADSATVDTATAPAPMRVEVVAAAPEPHERRIELRGEVSAARQVQLRAETAGTVAELLSERGLRVAAGDPIVRLDAGVREALLAGARAQLASAEAELQAAQSLGTRGLGARTDVERASAASALARAEVDRWVRDLDSTLLQAPFAGLVESLPVEVGQLIERGDPVAMLIDDSAFDVVTRAPQQLAGRLTLGTPVDVELLTGERLVGTLSWVSRVADPATRTFGVEIRLDTASVDAPAGRSADLAAGASAKVSIPMETVEAVFLSPSTLTLGPNSELGIKHLDAEDRVRFQPVELVDTELDGAWVTGVPVGARVVTLGQGFVSVGEQVIAAPATSL